MFRQFQIVTTMSHFIFVNFYLHVYKHVLDILLTKYIAMNYLRRSMPYVRTAWYWAETLINKRYIIRVAKSILSQS
jgi:hypothetical protein